MEILAKEDLKLIQEHALGGKLRSSKLRSIHWRILLNILPLSPSDWLKPVQEMRSRYCALKDNYTLDPRRSTCPPDDNPLSQDKNVGFSFIMYT